MNNKRTEKNISEQYCKICKNELCKGITDKEHRTNCKYYKKYLNYNTKIEDKISNYLYQKLDHMYCDNCRYDKEIGWDLPCLNCYCRRGRIKMKNPSWGINQHICDMLAKDIIEIIKSNNG